MLGLAITLLRIGEPELISVASNECDLIYLAIEPRAEPFMAKTMGKVACITAYISVITENINELRHVDVLQRLDFARKSAPQDVNLQQLVQILDRLTRVRCPTSERRTAYASPQVEVAFNRLAIDAFERLAIDPIQVPPTKVGKSEVIDWEKYVLQKLGYKGNLFEDRVMARRPQSNKPKELDVIVAMISNRTPQSDIWFGGTDDLLLNFSPHSQEP